MEFKYNRKMAFDIAVWKSQAAERLKKFGRKASQTSSYMTYATLATMTLFPVFETIGRGDVEGAITALIGVGASVGAGIITQKALDWKGKTDIEIAAEATRWIETTVQQDEKLRQSLDAILIKLEATQLAQSGLADNDREWFIKTLQDEIKQIGSTINLSLYTDGGAFTGEVNTDTFIGRDQLIYNYYCAPTGERKLNEAEFKRVLTEYLEHVTNLYRDARLFGETSKSKTRRKLESVFVPLTLRKFDPPNREEIQKIENELVSIDERRIERRKIAMLLANTRRKGVGFEIPLTNILLQGNKMAVVGGAGSGKSTLLAYIAAMLSVNHPQLFLPKTHSSLVPLVVPFRAYRLYVDECSRTPGLRLTDPRAGTLAGFIPWWLKRRSGLLDASQDFFDRLLRSGACLLMLDGLDEVVNSKNRRQIRNLVEQLVNDVYPRNIFIVTAREAGYREDAVFGDDFLRMDVQPLSEPQIERLVSKWCTQLYPTDFNEQTKKLMRAIKDINNRNSNANDSSTFISTPLMTTMVISMKENETELPLERSNLYEACVRAMLQAQYIPDDPDDTRKSVVEWGGSWEDQRTWLSKLAMEMHKGGKVNTIVTEDKIRSVLGNIVPIESLNNFVEAVRNRGGLLEERAELFQFAHLTFQEFLTARSIVKQRKDGLDLFQPYLTDSWWREVALLIFGFAKQDYEPFALEYLDWLSNQTNDIKLDGLELAGTALLELDVPNSALTDVQAKRLCTALTDPSICLHKADEVSKRGHAGRVLAVLGDPRDAVNEATAMEFCYIPSGSFFMGNEALEITENPMHVQNVEHDFWIGRFPVTQAQFKQFVKADGYKNKSFWSEAIANSRWINGEFTDWNNNRRSTPASYENTFMHSNHPVVGVSWYEALAFCRWMSHTLSRHSASKVVSEKNSIEVRLLYESEWEYAARGPQYVHDIPRNTRLIRSANELSYVQSDELDAYHSLIESMKSTLENRRVYPWGNATDLPYMNYPESFSNNTNAVGIFPLCASLFGCEDMSGNVWEWTMSTLTNDYYDYSNKVSNEPDASGRVRVIRGGSTREENVILWHGKDESKIEIKTPPASCSYRIGRQPEIVNNRFGFRVAIHIINH